MGILFLKVLVLIHFIDVFAVGVQFLPHFPKVADINVTTAIIVSSVVFIWFFKSYSKVVLFPYPWRRRILMMAWLSLHILNVHYIGNWNFVHAFLAGVGALLGSYYVYFMFTVGSIIISLPPLIGVLLLDQLIGRVWVLYKGRNVTDTK